MDEKKLKEFLITLNENIRAIKEGIEDHRHDKEGEAIFTNYEVIPNDYDPRFKELFDNDIEEIFFKEKKRGRGRPRKIK